MGQPDMEDGGAWEGEGSCGGGAVKRLLCRRAVDDAARGEREALRSRGWLLSSAVRFTFITTGPPLRCHGSACLPSSSAFLILRLALRSVGQEGQGGGCARLRAQAPLRR